MACKACKIADIAADQAYSHLQVVGSPEEQERVARSVNEMWNDVHTRTRKELGLKGRCNAKKRR